MEVLAENKATQQEDDVNLNTEHLNSTAKLSFSANEDEEEARYGWFSIRPKCIQWLNSPKGFLLCMCLYLFGQGMTVNGLVYVVITTLERRFNFTSVESAFISSTYDFFFMIIVIFVTYFGERAHKPKILGTGALIFACGSVVFMLPHFLSGPYNYEGTEFDTCDSNRTDPDVCFDDNEEENLRKYYPVFIIAQGLHALGASSIFTLGLTYIDENSPPGTAAIHTGIFYITTTLGPAAGFLLGSEFLNIYTDVLVKDVAITPESPLFVGAWWIGFIITASVCLLISVPLLGFTKHLSTYKSAQRQRHHETRSGADFKSKTTKSGINKVTDFPRAVWTLLRNPTYLFIDLASITEAFLLSFLSLFAPKLVETLFNLSAGDAVLYTGFVIMPTGIIGSLAGAYVVKKYNLTVAQILKFLIVVLCISGACVFCFLLSCSNVPFAGVTVHYQNTTKEYVGEYNLTAPCNSNCKCEDSYDAVCGSDGVVYYSSCHAGCTVQLEDTDGVKKYGECFCIPGPDDELGTATVDTCSHNCTTRIPFFILLGVTMVFTFMVPVPYVTATIRCVDYSQRSFALGLQTLLNKSLGLVPGPIAFGALIDKSCLLWEYDCNGGQNCWVYHNWQLAIYSLIMILACRAGSVIFYSLALATYKPATQKSVSQQTTSSDATERTTVIT